MMNPVIVVHGGAGVIDRTTIRPEWIPQYEQGLKTAVAAGYEALRSGLSATEAVVAAVVELENNPLFNAGKGAVFNSVGEHELDSSIMDGQNLKCGAIAAARTIKNPIVASKKVMDVSNHVLFSGAGADKFAKANDIELVKKEYFFYQPRYDQWKKAKKKNVIALDHDSEKKFGTVGAVALDQMGNLAAGTSTGGLTNQTLGRVGDTPLIGSGTYANNLTCAVSSTGEGEYFIRAQAAVTVSHLMEFKGLDLVMATKQVVFDLLKDKLGGSGGLIAVDRFGNIAMPFNTPGMFRGFQDDANEGPNVFMFQ